METIGYIIKRSDLTLFVKSLYHTLGTARRIASLFNGDTYYRNDDHKGTYEVFEVTGIKKVER